MNRKIPNQMYQQLQTVYDKDLINQIGSGKQAPKAVTLSSDWKDLKGLRDAGYPQNPAERQKFISETEYANSMDIATWFTYKANQDGWPKIDADRVAKVKTDEFRQGLKNDDRPIDGLKTIGSTMLHELLWLDMYWKAAQCDKCRFTCDVGYGSQGLDLEELRQQ
ncbi:MAG: hypothetical protein Q9160_003778 [Pyrenula sp. 1 TL-2023]